MSCCLVRCNLHARVALAAYVCMSELADGAADGATVIDRDTACKAGGAKGLGHARANRRELQVPRVDIQLVRHRELHLLRFLFYWLRAALREHREPPLCWKRQPSGHLLRTQLAQELRAQFEHLLTLLRKHQSEPIQPLGEVGIQQPRVQIDSRRP